MAKHFPDLKIPTDTKGRNRLHQQVDPVLLQDPEFRARHEQFRTKIALAIDLSEEAIRHKVPFGVVVFDAWYLAEDLVRVLARRRKDWISLLKKNRLLETASFHVRDAHGWPLTCLPAVPDRTKGLIQTIGDACRQQGRALLQKLLGFVHDQLSHGAKPDHVFAQLFAKQRDMLPA